MCEGAGSYRQTEGCGLAKQACRPTHSEPVSGEQVARRDARGLHMVEAPLYSHEAYAASGGCEHHPSTTLLHLQLYA